MKALVTGGAGYIGSHTCRALAAAGIEPVVYDDLSNGHEAFVRWGPLERGDLRDRDRLAEVVARHRPAVAVHFAGLIEVGQSVRDPHGFMDVNVGGTLALLAALGPHVPLVFSSTCAIYGTPERLPLAETHPRGPVSPYGRSKLMVEQVLDAMEAAGQTRAVRLRYFNAAGASADGRLGEWHEPETHVVPLLIEAALGRRGGFTIFGSDYDTPDGTCIRDFVHVEDLADAHLRAVRHLLGGGAGDAFNLGTGTGTSVLKACEAVMRRTGRRFDLHRAERRPGDPAVLVADPSRARDVLGWRPGGPGRDLDGIVDTAWAWHERLHRTRGPAGIGGTTATMERRVA